MNFSGCACTNAAVSSLTRGGLVDQLAVVGQITAWVRRNIEHDRAVDHLHRAHMIVPGVRGRDRLIGTPFAVERGAVCSGATRCRGVWLWTSTIMVRFVLLGLPPRVRSAVGVNTSRRPKRLGQDTQQLRLRDMLEHDCRQTGCPPWRTPRLRSQAFSSQRSDKPRNSGTEPDVPRPRWRHTCRTRCTHRRRSCSRRGRLPESPAH